MKQTRKEKTSSLLPLWEVK